MRGDAIGRVTAALRSRNSKREGDNWQCPAHDDGRPSMNVRQGDKGALVHCYAGCDTKAIVEALGLRPAELFDDYGETVSSQVTRPARGSASGPTTASSEEATYEYRDEIGKPLYRVVRKPGKKFHQERWDPDRGEFIGGSGAMTGVRRVPFMLPELIAGAARGGPIYIAEGEADVLALTRAGVVATCNPGGAGASKWGPVAEDVARVIADCRVLVIADADDTGRKHAAAVRDSLAGIAASVTIVEAAKGKDARDHLEVHGLGLSSFVEWEADADPASGDPSQRRGYRMEDEWLPQPLVDDGSDRGSPPRWVSASSPGGHSAALFYEGMTHMVAGKPGSGKTWLAAFLAADVIAGGGTVWWVDSDRNGRGPTRERLVQAGVPNPAASVRYMTGRRSADDLDAIADLLEQSAAENEPTLLVVDSWGASITAFGLDENSADSINRWAEAFLDPIIRGAPEVTVLIVDHLSTKKQTHGGDSTTAMGSTRKEGLVDVPLRVEQAKGSRMSRTSEGQFKLHSGKDRPGHHTWAKDGPVILTITPDPNGGVYGFRVALPRGEGDTPPEDVHAGIARHKVTGTMEKASRWLALYPGAHSTKAIREGASLKHGVAMAALFFLERDGFIAQDGETTRSTPKYRFVTAYDQRDDPSSDRFAGPSPFAPTRSREVEDGSWQEEVGTEVGTTRFSAEKHPSPGRWVPQPFQETFQPNSAHKPFSGGVGTSGDPVGTDGPVPTGPTSPGEVGPVGPPSKGTTGTHPSGKVPKKDTGTPSLTRSRERLAAVEDERLEHLNPMCRRLAAFALAEVAAGAARDATALYGRLAAAEGEGADEAIRTALAALIELGEVTGALPSRYRKGGAS